MKIVSLQIESINHRKVTSNQIGQNLSQNNQDILVPDLRKNFCRDGQDVIAAHGRTGDVPPTVDGRLAATGFGVV